MITDPINSMCFGKKKNVISL